MKNLFLFLFAVSVNYSFAQLTASNDTSICAGQSVQLSATGGGTYTWSPSNTLTSSTIANPVATPTATTSYVVSSGLSNVNMVVNGDFSLGNTGFTSAYNYEVPTNLLGPGNYFVGGNANHWNTGMSAFCNDRNTDADTLMLIANSSIVANTPVWCQTHQVYPNSTYTLSAYFITLNLTNLNPLRWMVNGTPVGTQAGPPFTQCLWVNLTTTWNSGTNTTAEFCIYNPTVFQNGNDFAIDQISITGTGAMTDTVTITVHNPVVNLGSDTAVCPGRNAVFDAGIAGGVSYQWNGSVASQTITADSFGTYSVVITDSFGCTATDAVAVTEYNLSLSTNSTHSTCGLNNGTATAVLSNGHSPFSYEWNTNDSTVSITGLSAGTYSVTASDNEGCSASASAVVNPSGNGTVTITALLTQICNTDTTSICAAAGYNGYLWNTGDTGRCVYTSLAGNYYVTVTDNDNCTASSNHIAISVFPAPSVSVTVKSDTLISYDAVAYQWYLDGSAIAGAVSDMYIATQTGNYSVEITDSNGCRATSTSIPVVTGIEDLSEENIRVYPNPNTTGNWQLAVGSEFTGSEITLTDINGRAVFKSEIRNPKSEIKTDVPSGVYLLRIVSKQGTFTRKLTKL